MPCDDALDRELAKLSPYAVERLGELLDSGHENVRLDAVKVSLDRYLCQRRSWQASAFIAVSRTIILPR
jgi:hypothetical protein